MIWGATFDVIADMQYVGNGSFKKENVNIKFVDPNDPTTNPPSWLTWVEERYYFISTINGASGSEYCDCTYSRKNNVLELYCSKYTALRLTSSPLNILKP